VCVRADSETTWTELIETKYDGDDEPWFRDDIGRAVLYVNNETPHSTTPGFSSEQDIIPVEDVTVFPEVGRVIVDAEQITYSGSSYSAVKPGSMIACEGQYFEEAPHDNAYWVDGVIATVPYDPSDIHIGNLDYDTHSQYLVYGKCHPHALDRIDKVRVRVWKEDRSPNVVYAMQPSTGKFWRCDDISVGSPTWTELTIPALSYEGTLSTFFVHPTDFTKAYVTTHVYAGSGDPYDDINGPRIYLVSGLNTSTLSFSEIFSVSDMVACIPEAPMGGGYQRGAINIFWNSTLGYFIGICKRSNIGSSPMHVYGTPGDWHGVAMTGTWVSGAGSGQNAISLFADGDLGCSAGGTFRSPPGGLSWTIRLPMGIASGDLSMISDGTNVIFLTNAGASADERHIMHHTNEIDPVSALYGSAVEITPTDGSYTYYPQDAHDDPWHMARSLVSCLDGTRT